MHAHQHEHMEASASRQAVSSERALVTALSLTTGFALQAVLFLSTTDAPGPLAGSGFASVQTSAASPEHAPG